MIALLASSLAFGMDVEIATEKRLSAYLFVDGVAVGRVSKRDNNHLTLADGASHELWFSLDAKGAWEVCRGVVTGPTLVTFGSRGCTGLAEGPGPMGAARHAAIVFPATATDALISLDGSDGVLLPDSGVRVTVIPATHSVRITTPGGDPLCAGKVAVRPGDAPTVAIGVTSCGGLQ